MTLATFIDSGYADSRGVSLYYEAIGEGPPLILLNGGPGFPHEYLQATKVLASEAKLVYFDQRGTGKSGKADPAEYTIAANVADVEAVRTGLGLGPCAVFGHSWGGMLAQAYAVAHPEAVTKLILADTFSTIADLNAILAQMRASVPAEIQAVYNREETAGIYREGGQYTPAYQEALDAAYDAVFLSTPPPDYLQNAFAHIAYDVYRAMWGDQSDFRVTGTLAEFDVWNELPAIAVPTLVLVGASDMPTVDMARAAAERIPGGRLEVFGQTRHFPFLEEPEKFAQVMREFLAA